MLFKKDEITYTIETNDGKINTVISSITDFDGMFPGLPKKYYYIMEGNN